MKTSQAIMLFIWGVATMTFWFLGFHPAINVGDAPCNLFLIPAVISTIAALIAATILAIDE